MTDLSSSPLHSGLLASVSRSFYLSLRVLPRAVRAPLSLGYLLARAADTIADVPACPTAERLALLTALDAAIQRGEDGDVYKAAAEFALHVSHEGERILLQRLAECLAALRASPPDETRLLRSVLERIIRGQSLDLQRFPEGTHCHLDTAAELDEYTWLVAGCVGEFWTEICLLHLPKCSKESREVMLEHGVRFGKGLQLVNILRDQPRDMAGGRCYLPADELFAAGLPDLNWPAADWKPWHRVRHVWLDLAREYLQSGRIYAASLRSVRLRLAVLLPMYIGEATLDLLAAQPDTAAPQPAKIRRPTVKRLMLRALWRSVRGF
jgi:farnesyl-diphosphate farnesyltransferase